MGNKHELNSINKMISLKTKYTSTWLVSYPRNQKKLKDFGSGAAFHMHLELPNFRVRIVWLSGESVTILLQGKAEEPLAAAALP
jgi:hypothetical protein